MYSDWRCFKSTMHNMALTPTSTVDVLKYFRIQCFRELLWWLHGEFSCNKQRSYVNTAQSFWKDDSIQHGWFLGSFVFAEGTVGTEMATCNPVHSAVCVFQILLQPRFLQVFSFHFLLTVGMLLLLALPCVEDLQNCLFDPFWCSEIYQYPRLESEFHCYWREML